MRRLFTQLTVVALVIPGVVHGDSMRQSFIETPDACYQTEREDGVDVHLKAVGTCSSKPGRAIVHAESDMVKIFIDGRLWKEVKPQPLGIPDVESALDKAHQLSGNMTLPPSRAEAEMNDLAGKVNAYYGSQDFQARLKGESQRITSELFGEVSTRFYPDSKTPASRGKLDSDERIYIFVSSSMPLQTVRNYAASVARLGDPGIILVMRGFVDGMSTIQPTIMFIGYVLQRDPACNPVEGECEMLPTALAVDPLLFRRYGIDRVPAVVYARGIKTEDSGLSEGDIRNTAIAGSHIVFGDASLEYLIEQIQRETGAQTLINLLTTSSRMN